MKKKILILTNIPVPYKINFYKELSRFYNLTVVFEGKRFVYQKFDWNDDNIKDFKCIYLSDFFENKLNINISKYINKKYDAIFVTTFYTKTSLYALLILKLKRIPYFFEIDGAFPNYKEFFIKYLFKKFFIKGALKYFSPCIESDKYLMKYGIKYDLITRYNFAAYNNIDIISEIVNKEEKKELRRKLGITEKFVLISVGQFIHRKGHDILIKALIDLNDRNIGCYIIGGEPTQYYEKLRINYRLDNLHFVNFMDKYHLNEYYKAADVFTFPTREDIWGLVVNEAMSNGLPVITTNRCNAGLEMVSNDCGYIIKVDDYVDLSKKIKLLINNDIKLNQMSEQALKKAKMYSIEQMASKHIEILNKYFSK